MRISFSSSPVGGFAGEEAGVTGDAGCSRGGPFRIAGFASGMI
jgi:hypothetical protein